jgi:hypothetical protein
MLCDHNLIEGHTDVSDGRGDADFNTGITLLSQFTGEELVQLGIKNTVRDELAALGDSLGLSGAVFDKSVAAINFKIGGN